MFKPIRIWMAEKAMNIKMGKKGVVEDLMPLITSLVAIGITLVVAFLILDNIADNSTVTADTNATQSVKDVQNSLDTLPGFLPIIVITVIGVILLGLIAFFRSRRD